jgi:hypothetical protein
MAKSEKFKRQTKKKEERVYLCKLCGFVAIDEEELNFHMDTEHSLDDFGIDESEYWWI